MDIKENKANKASPSSRKKENKEKIWLGSYIVFMILFLAAWLLLRLEVFRVFGKYGLLLQKLTLGGFLSCIVLGVSKLLQLLILRKAHLKSTRYNLVRLVKLLSVIFIILIITSFLFVNWYAAAVSLGLISLILGFALQTPISSFIGWIYILIRNPYRIGDRIQIDTFKGDVVEIGYLDTTLWEFAGEYLTNDLPSGRLIRFPNSLVLQSAVFNYSWQRFPFIWNEIPFHIAYESDLEFVQTTIRESTKDELGKEMAEKIRDFKELMENTPVDDLDIKEYPFVSFRTNTNTWVEATVTYLVDPKKASATRTRLMKKIINALLSEPERVMFPKGNAR
jgi:small-conductance mechanosensitive channel